MNTYFRTALIFMISLPALIRSQGSDPQIFSAVDSQIWQPFIRAFNAMDAEAFNALHSEEVLRGGPWGLLIGEAYYARNINNFQNASANGDHRRIALTFISRTAGPDVCYDVGYYRIRSKKQGETESEYYGYFHVVHRKIAGIWKITQDWDTSEVCGQTVSPRHFEQFAAQLFYE